MTTQTEILFLRWVILTEHRWVSSGEPRRPETTHTIWGSVLAAWLARPGKSPKEQVLKSRLAELMRE